jgi:hypothetical protein
MQGLKIQDTGTPSWSLTVPLLAFAGALSSNGNQSIDVTPNNLIACARSFLEAVALEKRYLAPMGLDQPISLQLGCHLRYGCPSHAEHAAQELMRERDDIAVGLVACLQQPSTQATGHFVQSIARRGLLDLAELKLRVSDDQLTNPGAFLGGGSKGRGRDAERVARDLHQGTDKRDARSEADRHPDGSFRPNRPDLDGAVLRHLHNERNHSGLRKINLLDRSAGLLEHISLLDRYLTKVAAEKAHIFRLQRRKKPVPAFQGILNQLAV